MSHPKVHQVDEGEPVTIELGAITSMVCCDCKLTHLVRYMLHNRALILRAWRDDELTATLRRRKRHAKRR